MGTATEQERTNRVFSPKLRRWIHYVVKLKALACLLGITLHKGMYRRCNCPGNDFAEQAFAGQGSWL